MKDLRECGEVGPSENGELTFSCLFCGDKLSAMELIIDHINAFHKDKITFEPDALKKRPRRKRKSELPVSEWIHLEKERKRKPGRISRKKLEEKQNSDTDVNTNKDTNEEKENSKPDAKENSRLAKVENEIPILEKNQYARPKRAVSQTKAKSSKTNTEIPTKFVHGKKRGRKKKNNFTIMPKESDEETPIKIRLKRRGKEMIIENTNAGGNVKVEHPVNITAEEVDNKAIAHSNTLLIPQETPEENKNFESKAVDLDCKIVENIDYSNKVLEEKEKTFNFVKDEKTDFNYVVKPELMIEDIHNLKKENIDVSNHVTEIEKSREEFEDNYSDIFLENNSVNMSQNNNSISEDDSDYRENQPEDSSSSDSDSEKISVLKEKLQKDIARNNGDIQANRNYYDFDESSKKMGFTCKQKVKIQNPELNLENMHKKRRKLKCTPKTRRMNEFGEYMCDLCGNTYKKATSLSRHRSDCRKGKTMTPRIRVRKENGLFPCTYENCQAEFSNVEEVFKHEKDVHGKKKYARPQTRKRNEFGEYVCDICGNVYKKGTSLSRHRALCREGIVVVPKRKKRDRMRNEKGMYQCAFHSCGLEFSKVEDVVAHERETHKGGKKKKIGRMCEVCGKWLTSACSFKSHMLRHSGERNYKCDQCSGAFFDKYALSLHKKVHIDVREYICEYCNRKFKRAPEMRKHIRYVHLNMRPEPVMCDLCGKYLHWKFDLKSHMRRHYNIKTIRCEFAECEQMFANRSDLKKHLITHNPDIKPWQCEICSNSFSRKSTLVKHQKLHTGTKEYTCSICGKAFAQSPGLYMHMKSHGFNLKPEGAARYERISHIAFRQMDSDRLSSLNFKQNNEINITNANDIQINLDLKNPNDILKQQDMDDFQHENSEKITHSDEDSKNLLNQKILEQHKTNQTALEIPTNQIATIHIESIQGVLSSSLITNPTITAIGNEIQINLGRPIQIDLGQLSQAPNH
ncbi:zinc finger protein 54-like [Condylostylus longicornis]|uniref:zinc finger protein 54-like n=1 Tax=Condylostylus longicornis TaxID=2530218 RepID=UPI00244DA19F|nr:zinc finger protein 54-like [Condylostylus longicornis]